MENLIKESDFATLLQMLNFYLFLACSNRSNCHKGAKSFPPLCLQISLALDEPAMSREYLY